MVELTILRTRYSIPYSHLEVFNQIVGIQISRNPVEQPNLLYKNIFRTSQEDNIGVLQARKTSNEKGFYVGLAYTFGPEDKYTELEELSARISGALKTITGNGNNQGSSNKLLVAYGNINNPSYLIKALTLSFIPTLEVLRLRSKLESMVESLLERDVIGYKTSKPYTDGERVIIPILEEVEMPLAVSDFRATLEDNIQTILYPATTNFSYEGKNIVLTPSSVWWGKGVIRALREEYEESGYSPFEIDVSRALAHAAKLYFGTWNEAKEAADLEISSKEGFVWKKDTHSSKIRRFLNNNPSMLGEIREGLNLTQEVVTSTYSMRGIRRVGPKKKKLFFLVGQEHRLPEEYQKLLIESQTE